jgi:Leucine-rich repeat (LRR) protein
MATKSRAGLARRKPDAGRASARSVTQVFVASLIAAAMLGVAGCEKPPTFSELINGKKKEAPPAPPVAKQAAPAAAAPQAPPKVVEAPKRTAQEALAQFNGTPVYRRTNAQLAELAELPEARDQITVLELQGSTGVDDAGLAVLPKFDHVERLNISTLNYSSAGLANVAKMKNVTAIAMSRGAQKDKNSDAAVAQLKQMKQLTELYVDQAKFSTAGIAEIAQMTQLEKLSVAFISQFADEHLEMLAPLVNLKFLDLSGSNVTDDGLKYLLPFTELEFLGMSKMQGVRGRGLVELIKTKKGLRKLTSLSVYDNPYLTVEGYQGIAHLGKTLVTLDAGAANVTNSVFVQAMPFLKNLEALSVHDNDALGDDAMPALPKRLKSLYFGNNKLISDRSVLPISKLKLLEALTISQTSITPTGARQLKAKLKNCKINYNGNML